MCYTITIINGLWEVVLTDHHISGKFNLLRKDEAHIDASVSVAQCFGEEEKSYKFHS